MPEGPPTERELAEYRQRADRFVAELDEEFYLHFAGLKDDFSLQPIYERYSDLTEIERAKSLGEVARDHPTRELWRFAAEGYLGNLTREHAEKVAELEAELQATVDGERIPFRMLRPTIANEADRARRERLEQARNELSDEHLNPLYLDATLAIARESQQLGAENYLDLYRKFGFPLDALAKQARTFLDDTEDLYEQSADRLFRSRAGVGLEEAERWDIARVFRASEWDPVFPKERMLPALRATLADLGIDLDAQTNVHLDIEQRPNKTPRAFCAPIEVPGKVMLVIQPIGGPDDWRALFHEAGHTEHYANTAADLTFEGKRLGDAAVTEGWAMLMEHLTDEPAWLERRLDFPRPREFGAEGGTSLLYIVRRYCAKLLYELEFHAGGDPTEFRPRYVELLVDAIKVAPSATDYLIDMDSSFRVSEYVRAWAFEAQLRAHLSERFGRAWFASREAGSLLQELWSEGQRRTADELLRDVTGAEIELEAVTDRVRERLS